MGDEPPKKSKPILGLVEEVKIYLPNGKFIRRKAKIDTGAHATSIDISIAQKIGQYEVYTQFQRLMPKFKLTNQNYKEIRQLIRTKIAPDLRRRIPGLRDIRVIPASNGITIRPYVTFEYKIRSKRIITLANIVDRTLLLYPVLIGKRDMKGFLINPAKHVYRLA